MLCFDMGMHEYLCYLQFLFEVHFKEPIEENFVIFDYFISFPCSNICQVWGFA